MDAVVPGLAADGGLHRVDRVHHLGPPPFTDRRDRPFRADGRTVAVRPSVPARDAAGFPASPRLGARCLPVSAEPPAHPRRSFTYGMAFQVPAIRPNASRAIPSWLRRPSAAATGETCKLTISLGDFLVSVSGASAVPGPRQSQGHLLSNQIFHCGTAVAKVPRWVVGPVETASTLVFPDPIDWA